MKPIPSYELQSYKLQIPVIQLGDTSMLWMQMTHFFLNFTLMKIVSLNQNGRSLMPNWDRATTQILPRNDEWSL